MTSNTMNEFGGRWTMEKLAILKRYLDAYTTALKDQPFRLTYVDAFAGNGYINVDSPDRWKRSPFLRDAVDDDAASVLKGSARLALEVDNRPFDHSVFVEKKPAYVFELRRLQAEFPNRDIRIEHADANKFLPQWCEFQGCNGVPWPSHRAVIFLDPYGAEVDWTTVQCIAETKSVDLWILFPLSTLTRHLTKNIEPDEGRSRLPDRVYGGTEWRSELYYIPSQRSPFGIKMNTATRDNQQAIVDLYLRKLNSVFEWVAPSPKWLYNSKNSSQYAFMFASARQGREGEIALHMARRLLKRR